ncbi:hypothetical protein PPACK8108_LOCUS1095 [Phakopsora pachyrhizi]|uniref:Uncharacterized protein n=1 Tax=Phakopsora pachyrhizi TaxID=170000 RepID=A0AAV0AHE7_PHAPC|nr:hypothetical protein PPACK8108_LOCUS1095 [Phakopsora pachyrhizi]
MVSPTSGAVYHVTKAQVHAHQLDLFALSLNRTLVLPQLLCLSLQTLLQLGCTQLTRCAYNHSCTIPNLCLEEVPICQDGASSDIINITPSNGTLSYLTLQSEHLLPIRPYRNFCVAKKKKLDLNFESFPTLLVISPQRWNQLKGQRDRFSHRIMDLLRKDTVKPRTEKSSTASVPDVLVFNYKL